MQIRLRAPQTKEREHAEDVHQDRPENRHGDNVRRERLPAERDELIAINSCDADNTACQNRKPRRLEARMHMSQKAWQVSGARQCKNLPRITENDSVKGRDQTKKSQPH